MSKDVKARLWWFICYPESLPSDWIDKLILTGLPFIVSPLHDMDVDSDGNIKKEHYHIIVIFNSPTTFNHVKKNVTLPLNATIPIPLLNLDGGLDYLTHKNNPDKAQYNYDDVCYYNGAFSLNTSAFLNSAYDFIENVIASERPVSLSALLKLCYGNDGAVSLIRSKPYYFCALMKDRC